ncbi:acetyltransferase (GNAT) family protein [Nonomuraea fuscirosea]|uniref:Acetyltransferase (GNAT) family protein n=1 Tax=Nonomuraea fuscirosea TaxID=1291556 RepID=A0A2T0N2B3_9ACTN|nr:GNAT family N-acetyltransferase [Nonomuraea fuscirosea]PRX66087.1 acetyltransferase (GNAT) family protein [Nonomuraea fuscirosea]
MGFVFRHMTGEKAKAVLDEPYVSIYLAIRAEPPYNGGPLYDRDRFLERTGKQTELPGFELVAAEWDGVLAGFAFGFTMAAGMWWGGETTPPPQEVVDAPKLAVVELDLLPEHRGQGVGRRLLSELLDDREEPLATLLSRPDTPAHAMYQRWGWRLVGAVRPAPDAVVADAMVTSLAVPVGE